MNFLHPATAALQATVLAAAIAVALVPRQAFAQHEGHAPSQPPPAETSEHGHAEHDPADQAPAERGVGNRGHAAEGRADEGKPEIDHAAMDHGERAQPPAPPVDHSKMDHSGADHADMDHADMDHSGMDHAGMQHRDTAPTQKPRTPIPALTDADRAAARPPSRNHPVHDNTVHSYFLFDRLETSDAEEGTALEWEAQAWIGNDDHKLWLRSEGERSDGHTEAADLEVLYGRSIARWWDLVAGVRHDFQPSGSQDFAAVGVMGVAPYKFEVEATLYVGESGQTAARFEAEYDVLLTNRLILQPLLEANLHGQDDEARGIGSGLSTIEAGLRLRYEITRQFAPYAGVVSERAFGGTADLRRLQGGPVDDTHFVAGVRIWF